MRCPGPAAFIVHRSSVIVHGKLTGANMTDEHVYYLGVDGGASKTAALVTDETGAALGDGLAGPSNHLRVGIETASRNTERAVNKALVAADVTSREIVWAYCGIAGAD